MKWGKWYVCIEGDGVGGIGELHVDFFGERLRVTCISILGYVKKTEGAEREVIMIYD